MAVVGLGICLAMHVDAKKQSWLTRMSQQIHLSNLRDEVTTATTPDVKRSLISAEHSTQAKIAAGVCCSQQTLTRIRC